MIISQNWGTYDKSIGHYINVTVYLTFILPLMYRPILLSFLPLFRDTWNPIIQVLTCSLQNHTKWKYWLSQHHRRRRYTRYHCFCQVHERPWPHRRHCCGEIGGGDFWWRPNCVPSLHWCICLIKAEMTKKIRLILKTLYNRVIQKIEF